jgi:hypothetical protein
MPLAMSAVELLQRQCKEEDVTRRRTNSNVQRQQSRSMQSLHSPSFWHLYMTHSMSYWLLAQRAQTQGFYSGVQQYQQ